MNCRSLPYNLILYLLLNISTIALLDIELLSSSLAHNLRISTIQNR